MKPTNCKKLIILVFVVAGLLASAFLFSIAMAFDEGSPEFSAALQDLSRATGQQVTTKDQAIALCDSEKYFTSCAEVGKKYHLYSSEEVKQVDVFVSELKGKIQEELQSCQTTECLIGVANKLSQKVSAKNPKLAEQAELTSKFVQKKQAIIEAAKELGVDFEQCRKMDPDTASVETLRGCAKLAKDSRVRGNLSKEALEHAEMADKSIELQDALKSGQVQCGSGTLESCGSFCLKPSTETRTQGTAAIPAVCRQIAEKYFGLEGVRHLEESYQQVDKVRSSYLRKAESLTFQTVDGQTITNPEEIGKYMEEQGKNGNVEAVEKGMDFMVNNGFIKPEEKDYALKFVKQIRGQGGLRDFDACSKDPQSCSDFIPPEAKSEFEAQKQIKEAITQETGFDPSQCGSRDPAVGEKCFQGAKKALEKLQTLENQNLNIQRIINDLRQKVNHQEEFHGQREQLKQVIQQQGGPGGCKSEEECRSFCSSAANGQECFSFGAKHGASGFQGSQGQERLQQFNQKVQEVKENQLNFPGHGPFPGFQPPGQGGTPPGQMEDFQKNGRDFQKDGSDFQKNGRDFQKDGNSFQKDGRDFQKDGQNFQRNGQDFQKDGRDFQKDGQNFQRDGRDFQKDGSNFQKDGRDFQKDGNGFQKDGQNFQRDMPQHMPNMMQQRDQQNQQNQPNQFNQQNQFQKPSGEQSNFQQPPPPPSGGATQGGQPPPPPSGGSGGTFQQPPPPPPPTGLINNSFLGNVARAFIRISN